MRLGSPIELPMRRMLLSNFQRCRTPIMAEEKIPPKKRDRRSHGVWLRGCSELRFFFESTPDMVRSRAPFLLTRTASTGPDYSSRVGSIVFSPF